MFDEQAAKESLNSKLRLIFAVFGNPFSNIFKSSNMRPHLVVFLSLIFFLSACGGGGAESTSGGGEAADTAGKVPAVAELTIEGNDMMQFDLKAMEVFAGQKVRLTLKHVGQMPAETMGHNWVLLVQGTDKADFASQSMTAKDTDYIAPSELSKVIAHTKIIGGGEETTIEFDAPAEGTYEFICSFPGHYALMNGTFTVKAALQ